MQFNLVHIMPNPKMHGLLGYLEIIETVRWGLEQLGHEVSQRTNVVVAGKRNILFGWQMMREVELGAIAADTIIYNLEQVPKAPSSQMRPLVGRAAEKFQIWDYSLSNIENWKNLGTRRPPIHVPIGWAPVLSRIPPAPTQDIDVLLYGMPSEMRFRIFEELCTKFARTMYCCGFYGQARDELIARSKIVLNVNRYKHAKVFEVARVSYQLGNGKAVVSDIYPESDVEPDIRGAVAFAPPDQVASMCMCVLEDEAVRRDLEARGPEVMEKRGIREILKKALGATPAAT